MSEDNNRLGYRYEAVFVEVFLSIPIGFLLIFLLPVIHKDISWGIWSLIAVVLVVIMFIVYTFIKDVYTDAYDVGVAKGLARSLERKLKPKHSNNIYTGLNDYFVKLKKKSYYIEFNSITFTRIHLDIDDIKTLKTEHLDNGITYYRIMLCGNWYDMQESYVIPDMELPLNTKDLPFNNMGIGKDRLSIYVERYTYQDIEKFWKENNYVLGKSGDC